MPPRKGNGCSPQFPRDSVAAALAPPPLLKLTPHPLQGGHTLLPFHSIHRLPSKLLAQTMLSQGSSSFHACLPERHRNLSVRFHRARNKSQGDSVEFHHTLCTERPPADAMEVVKESRAFSLFDLEILSY